MVCSGMRRRQACGSLAADFNGNERQSLTLTVPCDVVTFRRRRQSSAASRSSPSRHLTRLCIGRVALRRHAGALKRFAFSWTIQKSEHGVDWSPGPTVACLRLVFRGRFRFSSTQACCSMTTCGLLRARGMTCSQLHRTISFARAAEPSATRSGADDVNFGGG